MDCQSGLCQSDRPVVATCQSDVGILRRPSSTSTRLVVAPSRTIRATGVFHPWPALVVLFSGRPGPSGTSMVSCRQAAAKQQPSEKKRSSEVCSRSFGRIGGVNALLTRHHPGKLEGCCEARQKNNYQSFLWIHDLKSRNTFWQHFQSAHANASIDPSPSFGQLQLGKALKLFGHLH